MSRPQDVHRFFLPLGNPFRRIFTKRSRVSPKNVALHCSFEQTLAENLKKLKPEDNSDIWSLSWLTRAMICLSETHNSITSLITDLELPVSDWEEKWIGIYLDNSVKLLDICISLSSELSRLDHYQVLVKYALSSNYVEVSHPKLEDCCVILQGLDGTIDSSKVRTSAKGKVVMRALYGVKVVTVFLCSVFISALCGCGAPLITGTVPGKHLWGEAFNDLQAEVSKGKVTVLKEVGAVQRCVKRLCALGDSVDQEEREILNNGEEESWKESVLELAREVERLSLGLDSLSKRVGDFFRIVLMGRDALLCNLRVPDEVRVQESDNEDQWL